jgi:hypothetical protein
MKLISVQSRGNRLVKVERFETPGIAGRHATYCLSITDEGKIEYHHTEDYVSETWALKAAAKWLEGART